MSVEAKGHLTRAQAEGVTYKLPDDEQSKAFTGKIHALSRESGVLLEVLHLTQETFGCLSKPVLGWIAQELKIPRKEVYEAASFYSLFSLEPQAKYVIRACSCLSCYLNGSEQVSAAIRNTAEIPEGKISSEDGLFSFQTVSCIGLCDQSPAIMINHERYSFLTPEKARDIISELRHKEQTKEENYD